MSISLSNEKPSGWGLEVSASSIRILWEEEELKELEESELFPSELLTGAIGTDLGKHWDIRKKDDKKSQK